MMFNTLDRINVHIAIEAFPAPLKIALIKNNNTTVMLPPNKTFV